MERLLLKAATTATTDEGYFSAVISASTIDREKDIVDPAGMVRALHKWIGTGKNIPLAWNHSTAPEHQIGYIDPKSARVKGGEVVADGYIDQSIDAGAHAWRQVKAGTLGFSFGYLTLDSMPRKGGGRLLKELDVFEVTASPTPMNNDTRVLGWKAAAEVEDREQDTLEMVIEMMGDFLDTEDDAQDIAAARDILARLQQLLAVENAEAPDAPGMSGMPGKSAALRARADAVALEMATGGATLPDAPDPEDDDAAKSLLGLFPDDEAQAAIAGELKAPWTVEYLKALPDSAFLHERQFAFKDATGSVDLPHLRRALGRIPQSDLPQEVKDRLLERAARVFEQQKSVDGTAQAPGRAVDPLRAKAEALALEIASGGMSLHPQTNQPAQKATPDLIPLDELRERSRLEMLAALSGMDIEDE